MGGFPELGVPFGSPHLGSIILPYLLTQPAPFLTSRSFDST